MAKAKAKATVKSSAKSAPAKAAAKKKPAVKIVAKSVKSVASKAPSRKPLDVGNEVRLLTGLFKGTKGVVTKLGKSVQVQVKFAGEHTVVSLAENDLQRV